MPADDLQAFINDVALVVASSNDQYEITQRIAPRLSALLASGYQLPPEFLRPSSERHLTYPLYIAPDESWSLASVVWNIGQRTPVHGHETWGVVGIYSGTEREIRYVKPTDSAVGEPLTPAGEHEWRRGQVAVCCTTDDDVHSVVATGDEPTVGIHVYGGNIGTLNRPSYDPATGAVHWFTSGWDEPA
ncbi:cysteine dioxygenase family protein [Kribbella deserti]|uniref:Metal-dependent enzyme (Double-stranded beta helix superfamily) n=1 Tax=Kribbella deserti TaxID=1926257 RepID=A0ABV6QQ17_9ACTN